MAVVPKGKEIWIGNKKFTEGDELPKDYKLSETKVKKAPEKKDNE